MSDQAANSKDFNLGVLRRLEFVRGEKPTTKFAQEAGVPESTMRYIFETGSLSAENLVRIARAQGVSIEWLATGDIAERQEDDTGSQDVAPALSGGTAEQLRALRRALLDALIALEVAQ